jgi:hypothetical protein
LEELAAVKEFGIHVGSRAAMPRRITKDLQRDASHWRAILLHLEEQAAVVTKRLIQAWENPASPPLQARVRSVLLRLDLIEDRHGKDEPHPVRTGQDCPRDLVVRTKLQQCVGIQVLQSRFHGELPFVSGE